VKHRPRSVSDAFLWLGESTFRTTAAFRNLAATLEGEEPDQTPVVTGRTPLPRALDIDDPDGGEPAEMPSP
jgi:hypothetical protein